METSKYEEASTKRTYYQPKTIKDFYHTKWTDFARPKNWHPFDGKDFKSEYLHAKGIRNRTLYAPPRLQIILNKLDSNRLIVYLVLIFGFEALRNGVFDFWRERVKAKELDLLKTAFKTKEYVSNQEEEGDNEVVFDFAALNKGNSEGDKEEVDSKVMEAINLYMQERMSQIEKERSHKIV